MTRWLLRLYPPWFRDRYGDELAELIARSDRRGRDALNLAVHAGHLRWEKLMIRPLRHVANAVVVITVFGFGYTVNDLQGGITEIPRHWWSSFALGITVLSIAARAALELSEARRRSPSAP